MANHVGRLTTIISAPYPKVDTARPSRNVVDQARAVGAVHKQNVFGGVRHGCRIN